MEWASPKYSKTEVDNAGFYLFGKGRHPEIVVLSFSEMQRTDEAYEVVGNWRSSHNYPLNIFQTGLRRRVRRVEASGIVAQRIKRISSIDAKISRFPTMRLSMMQDIGGCRAVLSNVSKARELVKSYKTSDIKHTLTQEDDYIVSPKKSGYRGIHLIYRYYSDKITTWNGLKVEVQIRSTLQHAWATAVETVGTFIRQALKSSQGEEEWLRFFALMGSAMARREGTNIVPLTPTDAEESKRELAAHVSSLKVESHLQTYGEALKTLEDSDSNDHYFLLELDPAAKEIKIQGYKNTQLEKATADYLAVERKMQKGNDAVLVSVESLSALRRAYPNYFLDTHIFIGAVRDAIEA